MESEEENKKYHLLRTFGVQGSDESLERLLQAAGNDLDRAVNIFYERGIPPKLKPTATELQAKFPFRKSPIAPPQLSQSSLPSQPSLSRISHSFPHNHSAWLIGRRIAFGYTLNSGNALRSHSIRFKYEGELLEKTKRKESNQATLREPSLSINKTKRKTKFAAANILFECQENSTSRSLSGRLSNIICSFLVPLLEANLIEIRGHIAYDIGLLGVFQDVPLSLQIIVRSEFFRLMKQLSENVGEEEDHGESLKVLEAANELFLWLSEGESALISSRAAEKAKISVTQDTTSDQSPDIQDLTGTDASIADAPEIDPIAQQAIAVVDHMVSNQNEEIILDQPAIMTGCVEMKRYQLQAVTWMKNQELQRDSEGNTQQHDHNEVNILLPNEGMLIASQMSRRSEVQFEDEFWIECSGLPIGLSVSADIQVPCYYNQEDIRNHLDLIQYPEETRNEKKLKKFWWNKYTRKFQLEPPTLPKACRGGILADEMGLGKTVMMIALIAHDFPSVRPSPSVLRRRDELRIQSSPVVTSRGTLIVCPMSLIAQWSQEFQKRTHNGSIRVLMYYGPDRDRYRDIFDLQNSNPSWDVLITTYGVLISEWKKTRDNRPDSNSPHLSRASSRSESHIRDNIFNFRWNRVILDEGHCIRNQNTDAFKACCAVESDCRWIVTGTPIQNKIDDLYSLIKFLQHEPWSQWRWWYKTIAQPLQQNDPKGFQILQNLLQTVLIRRTKHTIDPLTHQTILSLPSKTLEMVYIDLNPNERFFYDTFAQRTQEISRNIIQTFQNPQSKKNQNTLKGYAALFTLLMRLRQICNHPVLVLNSLTKSANGGSIPPARLTQSLSRANSLKDISSQLSQDSIDSDYMKTVLKQIEKYLGSENAVESLESENEETQNADQGSIFDQECVVCLELLEPEQCCLTPCGHLMCWGCGHLAVQKNSCCPTCLQSLRSVDLIPLGANPQTPPLSKSSSPTDQRSDVDILQSMDWNYSSKMTSLLQMLDDILLTQPDELLDDETPEQTPSRNLSKVVIFSQWTSMLDLLESAINQKYQKSPNNQLNKRQRTSRNLQENQIKIIRFDGSMSQSQRSNAIEIFYDDPQARVFLVSLKAGGVGLNLTAASTVILVDPWWNPAVEDQAIDRIHRLGQIYPVRVIRMICRNTVEEKLMTLQETKRRITNQALGDSKLSSNSLNGQGAQNKLTLEELKSLFM